MVAGVARSKADQERAQESRDRPYIVIAASCTARQDDRVSAESYDPDSDDDRCELARRLIQRLQGAGFAERPVTGGHEQVYEREIDKRPGLWVLVYSTIVDGQVRALARDAIRAGLMYKPRSGGRERGLGSFQRVFRTGTMDAICDRTIERMRDAWRSAWQLERCSKCDAPKFKSKANNQVCAELCWLAGDQRREGRKP